MQDIEFNTITREIEFENGDFKLTENPSIQNGGIIKDSTCANIYFPTIGIGINENLINSPIEKVDYLMKLWQQQCRQDGATAADYKLTQNVSDINIEIDVSYL